jgi:hypothetical protein
MCGLTASGAGTLNLGNPNNSLRHDQRVGSRKKSHPAGAHGNFRIRKRSNPYPEIAIVCYGFVFIARERYEKLAILRSPTRS